jgi:hypothetical protein
MAVAAGGVSARPTIPETCGRFLRVAPGSSIPLWDSDDVTIDQGLALPPEWYRRWSLLSYLAGVHHGGWTPLVNVMFAVGRPQDGTETLDPWLSEARERAEDGLCQLADPGSEPTSVQVAITFAGSKWVGEIEALQSNGMRRRQAARDACLRWLAAQFEIDQRPDRFLVEQMVGFDRYYGRRFTDPEIDEAAAWLVEHRYIQGVMVAQAAVLFPKFTARGEWAVRGDESVNDVEGGSQTQGTRIGTQTTIHQTGTGNVAQAAGARSKLTSTVHQTFTQEQRQQVVELAEAIAAMVPILGFDEPTRAEATRVEQDLRGAVEQPEPDVGLLRRSLERVREVAVLGTATGVGTALAAHATTVLTGLGMG